MSECDHLCPACWLRDRRAALGSWLFARMPVGWRHRQVMRAAMAKRRDWRERRAFMLFSPHEEHAFRRSMRQMVREQRQAIVDGMMSACRTAWEESCE